MCELFVLRIVTWSYNCFQTIVQKCKNIDLTIKLVSWKKSLYLQTYLLVY